MKTNQMKIFEDKVMKNIRNKKRTLYTFLQEYDTMKDTYEDIKHCLYVTKLLCNVVITTAWYRKDYLSATLYRARAKIGHYKSLATGTEYSNLLQATWNELMALTILLERGMMSLVCDVVQGDRMQRAIPERI